MHGSHESMAHIEMDPGSTSVGRSDVVRHDPLSSVTFPGDESSGHGAGVEVIRYQPAQVEYHESPLEDAPNTAHHDVIVLSSGADSADVTSLPGKKGKGVGGMAPCDSLESIRSTESDSNELQSLMPRSHRKEKGSVGSPPPGTGAGATATSLGAASHAMTSVS